MSEVVSELIDRLNEYRSMGDKFYPEDIVIIEDIWLLIDEIERLHSIIKEVREYIEKYINRDFFDLEHSGEVTIKLEVKGLLEILDKENIE